MARRAPDTRKGVHVYRSFDGRERTSSKTATKARPDLSKLNLTRLPWQNIKLILSVLFVMLILKLSYISNITVSGINTPDKSIETSVKDAAKEYINERPWRHFQLFISGQDMESNLRRKVPNATNIVIKRSLFSNTVSITMLPKQPSAKWQQGRGGTIYIVDERGRAFLQSSGKENLPLIINEKPIIQGATQGQVVIDAQTILAATNWRNSLAKNQLILDYVLIDGTPKQATLIIKDKLWRLKVSTDSNVIEAQDYLNKSLARISAENKPLNEYIDIRIPYRVFYK